MEHTLTRMYRYLERFALELNETKIVTCHRAALYFGKRIFIFLRFFILVLFLKKKDMRDSILYMSHMLYRCFHFMQRFCSF